MERSRWIEIQRAVRCHLVGALPCFGQLHFERRQVSSSPGFERAGSLAETRLESSGFVVSAGKASILEAKAPPRSTLHSCGLRPACSDPV